MKKTIAVLTTTALCASCGTVRMSPDISTGHVGVRATLTNTAKTTSTQSDLEQELSDLRFELRKDEVIADPKQRDAVLERITEIKKELGKMELADKKKKSVTDHLRLTFWDFSDPKETIKSGLALAGGVAVATYYAGIWDFDDFNGKNKDREETRRIQAKALSDSIKRNQNSVSVDGSGNSVTLKDADQGRTIKLDINGRSNAVLVDFQQEESATFFIPIETPSEEPAGDPVE